jgi:hypothetical protein
MTATQFLVENVQRDLLHEPGAYSRSVSKQFEADGFTWCGLDPINRMQGPLMFKPICCFFFLLKQLQNTADLV